MGHLAKQRDASFFSCIFQPVPLWCAYDDFLSLPFFVTYCTIDLKIKKDNCLKLSP